MPLLMYDRSLGPGVYDKTFALFEAAGIRPRMVNGQPPPYAQAAMMLVASRRDITSVLPARLRRRIARAASRLFRSMNRTHASTSAAPGEKARHRVPFASSCDQRARRSRRRLRLMSQLRQLLETPGNSPKRPTTRSPNPDGCVPPQPQKIPLSQGI